MDLQSLHPEMLGDPTLSKGEPTAPFRRLTSELLLLTFAHLSPATRADALSILRVCRRWNEVLLRTPSFWANLIEDTYRCWESFWDRDRYRPAVMPFALAHSGTRPLRLSIHAVSKVEEDLLPHAPKLSYLYVVITATADSETFNAMALRGMPRLEHLSIAWDDSWRDPDTPVIHMGLCLRSRHFSQLHTLHIPAVHFSIDEPLLSLRHLILKTCTHACCETQISLRMCDFLDALERCSQLETLHLDVSAMSHALDDVPRDRLVSLPSLHKLRVVDDPHRIYPLLTHLDLPNASILEFCSYCKSLADAIPNNFDTLLSALSSAERVHFLDDRYHRCWHVATYVGDRRKVHIRVNYPMNDHVHTDVTPLVVHFAPYLSSTQHLAFIWDGSMPRMGRVGFAYDRSHCEALCAKLAPALDKRTRPTPLTSLVIRIYYPGDPGTALRVRSWRIGVSWRADLVQKWLSAGLGHLTENLSVRWFDGRIDCCSDL
ncbi:hypothetical protein C8Q74DRAFT_1442456 [Fomes fomentarius]|nr:hypothetical protein C8Q74DRAFT_1442456 [Fomes fomentarius]